LAQGPATLAASTQQVRRVGAAATKRSQRRESRRPASGRVRGSSAGLPRDARGGPSASSRAGRNSHDCGIGSHLAAAEHERARRRARRRGEAGRAQGLRPAEAAASDGTGPDASRAAARAVRRTKHGTVGASKHCQRELEILLPEGVVLTRGLSPGTIQNGDRSVVIGDSLAGRKLLLARTVNLPAGRVQPAQYAEFVQFARRADDAQSGNIRVRVKR
jgi:hypothetical protein